MLSTHIDPWLSFCRDLQIEGCEVHLYAGPNVYWTTLPYTPLHLEKFKQWNEENIYFLAGVKPGVQKRAADIDVIKRGMFTLDFDIKKELEKMTNNADGQFPTDAQQVEYWAEKIIGALEPHPMWGKFRYVVLSGNGMHVHYFGEPCDVVKDQWVAGMKEVFAEIEEITEMAPDYGCGNAGRIMRMPGSWNVKDPANKKKVDFIVWMPDAALPPLQFVQERGKLAIDRYNTRKEQERREFEESGKPESDLIALINSVPIEQVVKQLLGCEVKSRKKDGGLRFGDEHGVERGFFKHHQYNIIVHEGTSLFPAPQGKGYNCLGLARAVLGLSTHETINWFAERSGKIADEQRREKEQWAKEQHEEGAKLFEIEVIMADQAAADARKQAEAASFEDSISAQPQ